MTIVLLESSGGMSANLAILRNLDFPSKLIEAILDQSPSTAWLTPQSCVTTEPE